MNFEPTPEQEAFLRQAIDSGRYQTPEDAVRDAMARWEDLERSRVGLLTALNEAEDDLAEGRYGDYAVEALPLLTDELKREARKFRDSE